LKISFIPNSAYIPIEIMSELAHHIKIGLAI